MTIAESDNSQPKVTIITPPPDIRNVVDRTAQFVANLGAEFEARVKLNEANNPKFNFLISSDPYNGYYQSKVKQYLDGTAESTSTSVSVPTQLKLAQETPRAIQEVFEPKEPPVEFEFTIDPPSINSLELDIVKLTAQFVARNGRQFLTQTMNREQRNYLFDFLRPQHNMFSYFTKLVEQYTKILLPPKDIIERLDKDSNDPDLFMKNCKYRVSWDRFQARLKKREMEAEDKERVAYGQIDWHDFVVVEVVDYQANELGNFPAPTVPEEVGARAIAEERGETFVNKYVEQRVAIEDDDDNEEEDDDEEDEEEETESKEVPAPHLTVTSVTASHDNDDMDVEDMEMSEDEDDEDAMPAPSMVPPPPPSQIPPPPSSSAHSYKQSMAANDAAKNTLVKPDEVVIKSYDPKAKVKKPTEEVQLISPFGDKKKVPESQANKHIQLSLLDPNWRESKIGNVRNRNQDESPYAGGTLVDQNLKTLAERRTDIFGLEETEIGRKLGEDLAGGIGGGGKKGEKYVWDGQSTVSDAYLKRPQSSEAVKTSGRGGGAAGETVEGVDMDRIGPQAIPASVAGVATTITVIVNTPLLSQAHTAHDPADAASGPSESKRAKKD